MAEDARQAAVAALPMYDWPEVRQHTDALWHALAGALRRRGMRPPARLDRRKGARALWRDPRLLLGQTCGLPYVRDLRSRVHLVVTPCYGVRGCDGPYYRSFVVTRATDTARSLEEMRGRRLAYNARHSQSGYSALRSLVAPLAHGRPFFGAASETGSHRAALRAVADGRADLCAVDAVCWALACRHDPETTRGLKVIAETTPTAGLPLICAGGHDQATVERIREAAAEALGAGLCATVREALFITGAEALPSAAYDRIEDMERDAVAAAYPVLH